MASCKNDFLCALIANMQFLEIYSELFEPIDLDPIIIVMLAVTHAFGSSFYEAAIFFFALGGSISLIMVHCQ